MQIELWPSTLIIMLKPLSNSRKKISLYSRMCAIIYSFFKTYCGPITGERGQKTTICAAVSVFPLSWCCLNSKTHIYYSHLAWWDDRKLHQEIRIIDIIQAHKSNPILLKRLNPKTICVNIQLKKILTISKAIIL